MARRIWNGSTPASSTGSAFAFRNPGKSRKAEYYLFEKGANGRLGTAATARRHAVGRQGGYLQPLHRGGRLGSPEAFFTSVFSAQNRRPIASYQAGEIKKLLAELLGIDHLRDLSAKAGEVAKGLGRHLDTLQRDLVALSTQRERARAVGTGHRSDRRGLDRGPA
ncbi:hypothetical protein ACU4GD_14310 [Cupriavidus basilensis]